MEIEIHESRGAISRYAYLSPTGISRKFVVPETTVRRCIEQRRVPVAKAINTQNKQPERRVGAEYILGLIDCITRRHPGLFPDLEQQITQLTGVVIEVNPAQRPQNQLAVLRGRNYSRRVVTFIP